MKNQSLLEKYGPMAIILGASEGIGLAFAETLAAHGFDLLLVARRKDLLDKAADRIRKIHSQTRPAAATVPAAPDEATKDTFVSIDTLILDLSNNNPWPKINAAINGRDFGLIIYNAAASPIGSFLDLPRDAARRTVSVNISSPLDILYFAGNTFRDQRGKYGRRGGVILMSSLSGLRGTPRVSAYAATKAWNLVLAEGVYVEAKNEGVDVLACIAGATNTPGYRDSLISGGVGAPVQAPEKLAEETLRAIGKRGSLIPGRFNRLVAALVYGLLPRRWSPYILGKATSGLRFRKDAGE